MHPSVITMSTRSHLWLRLGAVALLALSAVWPRGSTSGVTASEAMRDGRQAQHAAARAETTAARLLSGPRTEKLVVATADESRLND